MKKQYQDKNKYKVFSCQFRRKDEPKRKGMGNFCNSQIVLEICSQNEEDKFIFKKIRLS